MMEIRSCPSTWIEPKNARSNRIIRRSPRVRVRVFAIFVLTLGPLHFVLRCVRGNQNAEAQSTKYNAQSAKPENQIIESRV